MGYTQAQLASLLECDQGTVSRLEQGKKSLDLTTMLNLHKKCKIDINWLLTGEGALTFEKKSAKDKREFADTDAEFLDLKEWLTQQSEEEPEIWAWFRVQLKKKFPEYEEWLRKRQTAASETNELKS